MKKSILFLILFVGVFLACDKQELIVEEDLNGFDVQAESNWNIQTEIEKGTVTALNEKKTGRASDNDFYVTAQNIATQSNMITLQRKSTSGAWYTYATITNSIAFAWEPITGQLCSDYGQWRIKKYYSTQDDVQLKIEYWLDSYPYDVKMQTLTTPLVGNDWYYLRTKDKNIHVQRDGQHIKIGGC